MKNKLKVMNVVKALKIHYYSDDWLCEDCPYFGDKQCIQKLVRDTIKLLKAYKTKE